MQRNVDQYHVFQHKGHAMKHHTTRAAALLAALALCAAPALAQQQEEELAPGFDACLGKSGGVTDKMEACAQAVSRS